MAYRNAVAGLRIRFWLCDCLPVGVLLYVTRPEQIIANAKLYPFIAIVNIFVPSRSLSCSMDDSVTRDCLGTSIGLRGVPLTVSAAPFIAWSRASHGESPARLVTSRAMAPYRSSVKCIAGVAGSGKTGNYHLVTWLVIPRWVVQAVPVVRQIGYQYGSSATTRR